MASVLDYRCSLEQSFFVPGPLPGLNEVLAAANQRRGKWNAYDVMKKQWCQTIAVLAKRHLNLQFEEVTLSFLWVERNKKRDPDNIASARKFILDALVQAKVLPNDGWACVKGWEDAFTVDHHNPGVHVTIRERDTRPPAER